VCLDRALGNVKIASDFGVVTSLEQELDNLSFPGSHLFELFFHIKTAPSQRTPSAPVALPLRFLDASGLGSLRGILHSHSQKEPGNVIG
jgi:hypothetical protein